ncbi:muscle, skeletal receptor tyrosine protein kinase-like, partial [Stylophora pistillata]|uniref:muscle, skeletal receptor tyrosine protein kinase-like n=1 Tax=Stylophora pistillata TaxID=50429 RepID=UPI000C03CAF1
WTKDGSEISNNPRISFSEDKNQLTITKAERVDSGAYRCVASNSLGSNTSDAAVVNVQYESHITTHPNNVTKREGENVTLYCNATGNPLPTLSWTKDGSNISNNPRISFSEGKNQLTITNAKRVDSGAYRCVANNSLGNDTSSAAVVNVQ